MTQPMDSPRWGYVHGMLFDWEEAHIVGDSAVDPAGFRTRQAALCYAEQVTNPETARLAYDAEKGHRNRQSVLDALRPTAEQSMHFVE
jgi:hypothetical protein